MSINYYVLSSKRHFELKKKKKDGVFEWWSQLDSNQ